MSCISYTITDNDCKNPQNNNQSDRQHASNSKLSTFRIVPRNPSSFRRTKTSLKPGALCPGGMGVDVKHNSYDRYLARKKKVLLIKDKQRAHAELKVPSCDYCK